MECFQLSLFQLYFHGSFCTKLGEHILVCRVFVALASSGDNLSLEYLRQTSQAGRQLMGCFG